MPETDPVETSPVLDLNHVRTRTFEEARYWVEQLRAEVLRVRLQLTEAQADREGLDWLEANGGRTFFRYVGDGWIDERSGVKHPSLRATIDAARLASSSEPPPTTET